MALPPEVRSELERWPQETDIPGYRWPWLSEKWAHAVRSDEPRHAQYGVHVRPANMRRGWDPEAEAYFNGHRVGDYFWRESGKVAQKTPPTDFRGFGRWYGYWGVRPVEHETIVSAGAFVEARRAMILHRDKKAKRWVRRPVGMDGLMVVGGELDGTGAAISMVRWAEAAAAERGRDKRGIVPRRRPEAGEEFFTVE